MRWNKKVVATTEVLLVFPAVLFMTALFVRNLQPPQAEPAHAAAQIVAWYAGRAHLGLWGFLMALPMAALVTGSVTLWCRWNNELALRLSARSILAELRTQLNALLVAVCTIAALGILAIVALHVLSD